MRLATFNILHGAPPGGRSDPGALARACAALGADVLALQEVDVRAPRSCFRDLAAVAARAAGMLVVFGRASRVGWTGRYGNALLVRGAIDDVEVVALPRLGRAERRVAVVATAMVEGRPALSVVATHLSVDRAEASEQLAVVLDRLAARPLPRVVLGDLNLRPEVVVPAIVAAGYEVADPSVRTYPADDPRLRIDHVAVAGLTIAGTDAVPFPISDHRALVCDVARP